MRVLRVVVVDDHPIFLDGVRAALRVDGIEVVDAVTTAEAAVASVAANEPDVVLMDVGLPGGGIEATQQIVSTHPSTRVLMLTMSEDQRTVSAALRAGASGYLVKGADRATLIDAVRSVAAGTVVFGPEVARGVVANITTSGLDDFPQLTEREREVLDLVGEGLTNAAISRRLFLSQKTVRNHVSNIIGKLGVDDRESAAALARGTGE